MSLMHGNKGNQISGPKRWDPGFPFSPKRFPFFYGWIVVFAGTLAVVFSIPGQTMGFSVFTDVLIQELGLTRVQLSMAYCIGTVISGLSLPYFGRLYDRLGARRMIVYSSFATGLVLLYLSQIKNTLFLLDGILPVSSTILAFFIITLGFFMIRASAQGVLTMTGRNAIGKWFDHHRGKAFALSGVVTAFSFSYAPRALKWMSDQFGWSGAWAVLGIITIIFMAGLGWLLFRDNPEECGLLMDGNESGLKAKKMHKDAISHIDYKLSNALKTWPFWAFNLSFTFISLYTTAVTFHIISIGSSHGRDELEVIGYFVPMAVVSVTSNILMGFISSRTRLKYLLAIMNAAIFFSVIGVVYLDTSHGVLMYVIGNGIAGGGFACLSGIVWPRFFGRKWLGAISGVGMSSMVIGSGIGPLLFGAFYAVTGNYISVLWICSAVPALLFFGCSWADNPQSKIETTDSN